MSTREELVARLAALNALSGDELRAWATPKAPEPVAQAADYNPQLDMVLSSNVRAPEGWVPAASTRVKATVRRA